MMKLEFSPCLLILALFLLVGCSSQKEKPEMEGYFATRIDENDEKLFQYTLDIQVPDDRKRGTRGGGKSSNVGGYAAGSSSHGVRGGLTVGSASGKSRRRSGGRSGANSFAEINSRLEAMLEHELIATGYCREGYQETERMTGPSDFFIRGKCSEPATDQDRRIF